MERVKTGIPGMDEITAGGLIPGSVNLVSGGTGTGKTIFCLQYLFNGAKLYNERGVYISFEESERALKEDVAELGMNFEEVGHLVKFVYADPYNMKDFKSLLTQEVLPFNPRRVVIDSITAVVLPMEDNFERKKEFFILSQLLKNNNCTTLLTSEMRGDMGTEDTSGSYSRFGVEEFLCDGVIVLHYAGIGGKTDRALNVIKMRKTNHRRSPVPMMIGLQGVELDLSE